MTEPAGLAVDSPPTLDTERVAAVAAALLEASRAWHFLFRHTEFGALARIVVRAAPTLRRDDQIALAKLGAWICGVDDLVDDLEADDTEIALKLEHYRRLVATGDCPELRFDPLAGMLVDALAAFVSRDAARSLWPVFATQLLQALEAMTWEREVIRRGDQVSLAEYLWHATDSVAMKPVMTAAAMLFEDAGFVANLPAFLTAERHVAVVIRLVNDHATRGREAREGAMNAFTTRDAGTVEGMLAAALHDLRAALARLPRTPTARFMRVFCESMIEMYSVGELA